ncbi:VOC family protein [Frigoribacterium sp. UYMn621]|uniref:VOC family protein n=1 Tax=Frigoribacterium sp. UYMn621 TaxID=3156343 RepID=UPI003393AA3A
MDVESSDTARSIEFYCGLLGWTQETAGAEFNDYVPFSKNGHRVAGMVANQSGTPDLWTVSLKTADADATGAAIVEHGGQVVFNHAVPGRGTMVGLAGILDATGYLAARQTAHWMPYFGVEDADAAASVVTGLGGTQLDPVTDSPFGRMAHLEDATGVPLTIIQVGRP